RNDHTCKVTTSVSNCVADETRVGNCEHAVDDGNALGSVDQKGIDGHDFALDPVDAGRRHRSVLRYATLGSYLAVDYRGGVFDEVARKARLMLGTSPRLRSVSSVRDSRSTSTTPGSSWSC